MKIRDLTKRLRKAGFVKHRHGATSHCTYRHPSGVVVGVPVQHRNRQAGRYEIKRVLDAIEATAEKAEG